jgi:hypothetical protein
MNLDLTCWPFRGESTPFRVEVQHHALEHLMADALEAHRVYELMMIRRPGDVWKYLWVKALEVPSSVSIRLTSKRDHDYPFGRCPWPDNSIPLNLFDSFFYWCWDDTSPESECWLREREGRNFLEFGRQLFLRIQQTQQVVANSADLLIRAEITKIEALQHCHDLDAQTPFELTTPDYQSQTAPKRLSTYYNKLRELLTMPEISMVAVRGDDDYHTMRLLCQEQLRRSQISGKPLAHELVLHALSDGQSYYRRWGAAVMCWQEGLGYGDLWINTGEVHATFRDHLENTRLCRMMLSPKDEGEIKGYSRTQGDGWVLYHDIRPGYDYGERCKRELAEFIEKDLPRIQRKNSL